MGKGEGREKWKWRGKMRVGYRGEQEGRAEETKWARESLRGPKGPPTQGNNQSSDPFSHPGAPRVWPGSCAKSPLLPPPCLKGQFKAPQALEDLGLGFLEGDAPSRGASLLFCIRRYPDLRRPGYVSIPCCM